MLLNVGNESGQMEIDESRAKRKRIRFWMLLSMGALLNYFFLYPILYIVLFDSDAIDLYSKCPDWVNEIFELSLLPVKFLYDNVPAYKALLDGILDFVE
jgi:hypothetical protein